MNKFLKILLISIGIIILIVIIFVIYYFYNLKYGTFTNKIMSDIQCQKAAQYYLDQEKELIGNWENASLGDSETFFNLEDQPVLKMYAVKKNDKIIGYLSINVSYDKAPFLEVADGNPPFIISEEKKFLLKTEYERDVEISKYIYLGGLNYHAAFKNNKGDTYYLTLRGFSEKQILKLEEIKELDLTDQFKPTAETAKGAHQFWDDILGG